MTWVCLGVAWYFMLKGDDKLKADQDIGWDYLCASAMLSFGTALINIFMSKP